MKKLVMLSVALLTAVPALQAECNSCPSTGTEKCACKGKCACSKKACSKCKKSGKSCKCATKSKKNEGPVKATAKAAGTVVEDTGYFLGEIVTFGHLDDKKNSDSDTSE